MELGFFFFFEQTLDSLIAIKNLLSSGDFGYLNGCQLHDDIMNPFQTILVTTRTGCIGTLVYDEKQVYPFLMICVAFRHLGNFRLVYNFNLTFICFSLRFFEGVS